MKEIELKPIELEFPKLDLPDQSYGYSNEPLIGKQMNPGSNRNISGMQFFALDVFGSSGTGDNSYRDILIQHAGENKNKVSRVAPILSGLGDITYTATLNYNTDLFMNHILVVPPAGVVEIYANFYASTENIRVQNTGSIRFLRGNTNVISNANPYYSFINSGTTHNKITIQYATSASDVPRFAIFMKIFY